MLFSNAKILLLAVRGLSPGVADLLEAVPNGAVTQAGKAVAGEVLVGEVADGLFFAARQDQFAEVLVRLLDALGRPTLRGDAKHGRIHHRDAGFANEPDSLGQRNSSVSTGSAGAFQTAGIRPALQRGLADAGRTGQIFGGKQLLHGHSIHRPKTPLSEPIVLF